MRFSELFKVIDTTALAVFDENGKVIALAHVGIDLREYEKGMDELEKLAEADEHIVTRVSLLDHRDRDSFIAVSVKKEVA